MLSLHPDAAWLHIGCDEVYQLGQCPICSQKLLTANTDPSNSNGYQDGRSLFLQHVHRVASYVKNQKNVIPIIWDDMLRTIPAHILQVGSRDHPFKATANFWPLPPTVLPNGVKVVVLDLSQIFQKWKKNGFIIDFEFILNEFGPKVNNWIHRVYKFGLITWLHYLRFCRKSPFY